MTYCGLTDPRSNVYFVYIYIYVCVCDSLLNATQDKIRNLICKEIKKSWINKMYDIFAK